MPDNLSQKPNTVFIRSGRVRSYNVMILTLISLLLVCFLIWSLSFKVTVYTVATGSVKHEDTNYRVDSKIDGMVAKVYAKNGQHVKAGDKLLELYNGEELNRLKADQYQVMDYKANLIRLDAIIDNKPLEFPPEMKSKYPDAVDNQMEEYKIEKMGIDEAIRFLKRNRDLTQAELDMIMPLVNKGALAKIDALKLETQVADIDSKISDIQNRYQLEAAEKKAEISVKLKTLQEVIKTSVERVEQSTVMAPVGGVVHDFLTDNQGDLIKEGDLILEILPQSENLTVVADLKPQDVGFIKPGLPVSIHVDAYDYEVYGDLKGYVKEVSPDSLKRDDGSTYFEVTIQTRDVVLSHKGKKYPVKPGMTVTANIEVNEMTFLFYLFKPLTKVFVEGFSRW